MRTGLFHILLGVAVLFGIPLPAHAQQGSQTYTAAKEPVWWFGLAGAANLNFYGGTTQQLNGQYSTVAPFHKGFGIGPYFAPVLEYRPDPVWGAILQLGYDDRRGKFDEAVCPCGAIANLSAKPAYISLEPSLRWSPFAGDLHLFAGPRIGFLWSPFTEERTFHSTKDGVPAVENRFSAMRKVVYSGQLGAGYDLELSDWFPVEPGKASTRIQLSPFVSYQPHFGQYPRDTDHDKEWWALSTLRIGAVLKFGRRTPGVVLPDVRFSVRAPSRVVAVRRIREIFPLRNYVYFGGDSLEFSGRYTRLSPEQARAFREEQLQDSFPAAPTGRSQRQLAVYHHLLNVVGDRLRRNPGATLTLSGLSARAATGNPRFGITRAEEVKRYLVRTFGIETGRISVEERDEPAPPLGRTEAELDMLRAENQRVDILSSSREMLLQVGEGDRFMLKPVEIEGEAEGTDSVVFLAAPARTTPVWLEPRGAKSENPFESMSWTLTLTEDSLSGGATRTFGPFTRSRETISAPLLLGNRSSVRFKAVMTARFEGTASGVPLVRRGGFTLSQRNRGVDETLRYGILFDIDQARAVSSYDRFLETEVAPRILDTSTVFIRGRTDVVAPTDYNLKLSQGRAQGVQRSLEAEVSRRRRQGVRFQPSWSGEDPAQAPFGNVYPEERNYNRTVIIDIVPGE